MPTAEPVAEPGVPAGLVGAGHPAGTGDDARIDEVPRLPGAPSTRSLTTALRADVPADQVGPVADRLQSLEVSVKMACRGLLVISDNWDPGWMAQVDGRPTRIYTADLALRALVVGHAFTVTGKRDDVRHAGLGSKRN